MSAPERYLTWAQIEAAAPTLAATMRAYLDQLGCTLRPRSVGNADQALRAFAEYLLGHHPDVRCVAAVERRHIEAYKPWLAARAGQNKPRLSVNTALRR